MLISSNDSEDDDGDTAKSPLRMVSCRRLAAVSMEVEDEDDECELLIATIDTMFGLWRSSI